MLHQSPNSISCSRLVYLTRPITLATMYVTHHVTDLPHPIPLTNQSPYRSWEVTLSVVTSASMATSLALSLTVLALRLNSFALSFILLRASSALSVALSTIAGLDRERERRRYHH
ncbi:hypothetical protein EON63_06605 [archaeon]|nr:MAG: hypothetical protein EON63_06605 [archaeon]